MPKTTHTDPAERLLKCNSEGLAHASAQWESIDKERDRALKRRAWMFILCVTLGAVAGIALTVAAFTHLFQ